MFCASEGCDECKDSGIGEIPNGSSITCSVCHKSGKDGYRWLQRSPETDPPPEPEPTRMPDDPEPEVPLTRKQKRQAKYGN